MIQEKRKFIRLDASIKVDILPYEITDENLLISLRIDSETKNISAGGILFRSRSPLPVNSLVQIRIHLPINSRPIEAVGEVRHLVRLKNTSGFDVGVSFLKISPENHKKIFHLKKI